MNIIYITLTNTKKMKKNKDLITVFPMITVINCPESKVKGRLYDLLGQEFSTIYGDYDITTESIDWIMSNGEIYDGDKFSFNNLELIKSSFNNAIDDLKEESKEDVETVFDKIRTWGYRKGIIQNSNKEKQFIKLMEEVGELSSAIQKNNDAELKDAIGDIIVVLTLLAEMEVYQVESCIESAYKEIKDRTGSIENGVFVKTV